MDTRTILLVAAITAVPQIADSPPAYTFEKWEPGTYVVSVTIGPGGVLERLESVGGGPNKKHYDVHHAPLPTAGPDGADRGTKISQLVHLAPDDALKTKVASLLEIASKMPVKGRDQMAEATKILFNAIQPTSEWKGWWLVFEELASGEADLASLRKLWTLIAEGLRE